MLWLVLGIPAATLAAGLWTLSVAGGRGAVDSADAQAHRTAQVQTRDLAADRAALARGLRATLRIERGRVLLQGRMPREELRLSLQHPFDAGRDLELRLAPAEDGWRAEAAIPEGHDWRAELQPGDGQWRLLGRCRRDVAACDLRPALATQ
jgi:hypothetical protein